MPELNECDLADSTIPLSVQQQFNQPRRFRTIQHPDDISGTAKLLNELNSKSPGKYRLLFAGRHGQGVHNLCIEHHGLAEWNSHWAKETTDGELVWGPDPVLTSLGESQAVSAGERLSNVLQGLKDNGIPTPKYYCSPMTRAAQTLSIGLQTAGVNDVKIKVLENLRETIGIHTCDKRSSKTKFLERFAPLGFEIEEGFTEEDELFEYDKRESIMDVALRVESALDTIFSQGDECIYLVAHSGVVQALLLAIGEKNRVVTTGDVVMLIIEDTQK